MANKHLDHMARRVRALWLMAGRIPDAHYITPADYERLPENARAAMRLHRVGLLVDGVPVRVLELV